MKNKKTIIIIVILIIIAIYFMVNIDDFIKGFKEGWNEGIKKA